MRVKEWEKFQHFKDRKPPWIKLYRELLDDPDWHELDPKAAKFLVMLWLIASEDETKTGTLPSIRRLAFRLRIKEEKLFEILQTLSHWLILDDIKVISTRYHDDIPETETETETYSLAHLNARFDVFWKEYPKKKSKGQAKKTWKKIKPGKQLLETMLSTIKQAKTSEEWTKENGQFIPYPATWLNAEGWNDEYEQPQEKKSIMTDKEREAAYARLENISGC